MADQTASRSQHVELAAGTHTSIEFTGPGTVVELAHHGDNAAVVYFKLFKEDPDDQIAVAEDGTEVLLIGERITVNGPGRRDGGNLFIELLSEGTPTVSVTLLQVGA